jgi:hypothetical protein
MFIQMAFPVGVVWYASRSPALNTRFIPASRG